MRTDTGWCEARVQISYAWTVFSCRDPLSVIFWNQYWNWILHKLVSFAIKIPFSFTFSEILAFVGLKAPVLHCMETANLIVTAHKLWKPKYPEDETSWFMRPDFCESPLHAAAGISEEGIVKSCCHFGVLFLPSYNYDVDSKTTSTHFSCENRAFASTPSDRKISSNFIWGNLSVKHRMILL